MTYFVCCALSRVAHCLAQTQGQASGRAAAFANELRTKPCRRCTCAARRPFKTSASACGRSAPPSRRRALVRPATLGLPTGGSACGPARSGPGLRTDRPAAPPRPTSELPPSRYLPTPALRAASGRATRELPTYPSASRGLRPRELRGRSEVYATSPSDARSHSRFRGCARGARHRHAAHTPLFRDVGGRFIRGLQLQISKSARKRTLRLRSVVRLAEVGAKEVVRRRWIHPLHASAGLATALRTRLV